MKRFLLKSILAASLGLACVCAILVVRIVRAQNRWEKLLETRPDVEVLHIGNSHTGCSWRELPEFRNQKIWCTSSTTLYSLLRLFELDRLGRLGNIKVVIADLDTAGLRDEVELNERIFLEQLPYAWRYIDEMPLGRLHLAAEALTRLGYRWVMGEEKDPEEFHPPAVRYTTRSHEERKRMHVADFDLADPHVERCRGYKEFQKNVIRKLNRFCIDRGIRLIFFAAPLTSSHRDRPREDREDKLADWFCYVRGLGVEYVDCRCWMKDEDFYDTNHLATDRYEEFTRRFFKEVGLTR